MTGPLSPGTRDPKLLAPRYALYVLGLLTVVNFVNYIDRQVVVAIYDDLRRHFGFSDAQLGALTSGFFLVHALTTVPFGWAADHYDRRKIMAFAVVAWSLATLVSAWALGFATMLLFRAVVGVGEAAYGPVSNAVLAESFPPDRKARVIAIYNIGMFVGAAIGMALGAQLGYPDAFLYLGIPGLFLGILVWRLKIPPRRIGVVGTPYTGFGPMLRQAWASINVPTLRWMAVSGILISFTVTGYITWFLDFVIQYKKVGYRWSHFIEAPPFLPGETPLEHLRAIGVALSDGIHRYGAAIQAAKKSASISYGVIAITGGAIGVIVGGKLGDWLQRRRPDGRIITVAIGFFAAVPFAILAVYLPEGFGFYASSWLMMFFVPWYNGPMAAVIDDVVDDDKAATAQASFTFFLHLLGSGPAAIIVGLCSDAMGLQNALMVPTGVMLISAVVAMRAARHVRADMAARNVRRDRAAASAA